MKLIDKDALIAEINMHLECANTGILYAQAGIEKGSKEYESDLNAWQHCQSMCKNILSFLDTLEVKEADLDEVSRHYALNNTPWDDCVNEIQEAYKAGFEFGLKAQKGE